MSFSFSYVWGLVGFFGTVFCIVQFVWRQCIIIVREGEAVVLERFQRFQRVLEPGLNFIVPFIDSGRSFTWIEVSYDVYGNIREKMMSDFRIPKRERVFNFPQQEVLTRDTVTVAVDAVMYYRINNPESALYSVDDLQGSISRTAETQMKEVFGQMTFSEALLSQDRINTHITREFGKIFTNWGVEVVRMELLSLRPKTIEGDLKKQMIAERERRGQFIQSEGQKASMRLTADGDKIVSQNMGLAEQRAIQLRAKGESEAKVKIAQAESSSLDSIAGVIKKDGSSQANYQIAQRYIDMIRTLALRTPKRTIYLPYDISGLSGSCADLPAAFGVSSNRKGSSTRNTRDVSQLD